MATTSLSVLLTYSRDEDAPSSGWPIDSLCIEALPEPDIFPVTPKLTEEVIAECAPLSVRYVVAVVPPVVTSKVILPASAVFVGDAILVAILPYCVITDVESGALKTTPPQKSFVWPALGAPALLFIKSMTPPVAVSVLFINCAIGLVPCWTTKDPATARALPPNVRFVSLLSEVLLTDVRFLLLAGLL